MKFGLKVLSTETELCSCAEDSLIKLPLLLGIGCSFQNCGLRKCFQCHFYPTDFYPLRVTANEIPNTILVSDEGNLEIR